MAKKTTAKRNPNDATFRNVNALKKAVARLASDSDKASVALEDLLGRVQALERVSVNATKADAPVIRENAFKGGE